MDDLGSLLSSLTPEDIDMLRGETASGPAAAPG